MQQKMRILEAKAAPRTCQIKLLSKTTLMARQKLAGVLRSLDCQKPRFNVCQSGLLMTKCFDLPDRGLAPTPVNVCQGF